MADQEINSQPDPSIAIPPTFFVTVPENVQSSSSAEVVDEIAPAAAAPQAVNINSESPQLEKPATVQAFAVDVGQKQHEIVMEMLDKWLEQISIQKRLSEEKAKQSELVHSAVTLQEMKRAIREEQDDPSNVVLSLGIVFAATGVQMAFLPGIDAGEMAVQPIANTTAKVAADLNLDAAVQMGIIGAIYSLGVQSIVMGSSALKSVKGEALDPEGKDFARGYAENVLALLATSGFASFLSGVVRRASADGKTGGDPTYLMNLLRLSLLSSSLALLYKAETGGLTGKEFLALIQNKNAFKEGTLEARVQGQILALLTQLGESGNKALLSLASHFNSGLSAKQLADPARTLRAMRDDEQISKDEGLSIKG